MRNGWGVEAPDIWDRKESGGGGGNDTFKREPQTNPAKSKTAFMRG